MRIGRNAILVLFVFMVTASAAVSFTLFGFRSAADVANNQVFKWVEAPARTPFVLTYAFADDFMAGQSDITQQEARDAVVRALDTWSAGTGGFITFEPALWGTIENGSEDFGNPGNPDGVSPPAQFYGPPLDEWLVNMNLPLPGWGSHIDFFTKPSDFSIWSQVITNAFHMTPPGQGPVLGFSLITRVDTQMVVSDIYLNIDFGWDDDGSNFDLETIVLHEVGHVLGLDHPNQAAANGAVNLDPYTFQAGATICPCDVMHSLYTGPKRELTDDELGGMAFLYRAGAGDLDGDQAVTLADISMALPFGTGSVSPNPYELWTLDFLNENGRVDAAELAIMGQWAAGALPYAPDGSTIFRGNPTPAPGEIILTAVPSPADIGKGGTVQIDVFIGNPDMFQVMAWEFELAYDTSVLSNPVCTPGTFPAMSLKTADETDDGLIETFNIAFNPDTSIAGLLATFTFDVDLLAAVGAINTAVTLNNAAVVVDVNGDIRNYGIDASEVMTINDAMLFASNMDANADGVVTLDDLYAWHLSPIDVNQDGVTDNADRTFLASCLRQGELADILPPAGN